MRSRTDAVWLALILGFLSTAGQVIVIRELLVASTGNELTIAVTLAIWIVTVALGSHLSGSIRPTGGGSPAGLVIIAALALPFQVLFVRALHPLVGAFGQMMSPGAVLALAAAGVLPSAAICGALFVSLVASVRPADASQPIQLVYGLEAVGAAAAGLALSFYLMEVLNPIALAAVTGMVCVLTVGVLTRWRTAGRARPALTVAAALGLAALLAASGPLNRATRQRQWGPLEIERIADSKYGSIVIAREGDSHEVFETGALVASIPDRLLAEETVHLPLLHHPNPRRVLLVGGTAWGSVGEVLKHKSVATVDYVEIDPVLASAVKAFAPADWLGGDSTGAVVRGHFADPRRYVAETRDDFDVVIVGAGTPTTLQVNRYYTVEFFRNVAEILAPDGLLALKVASPGAYAGPDLARLVAGIVRACSQVFPEVRVLPGEYIHVLASPGLDLTAQTGLVTRRLQDRGIRASFVNEYVLWDRLSPRRLGEIDSVLAAYDPGRVNSDLNPVAFAASMTIWEKSFGWRAFSRVGRNLSIGTATLLLLLAGLVAMLGLSWASRSSARAFPDLVTLYTVGLATMTTQVLAVLGFQIACGYIYSRVAGMVAAFMVGMGLAAVLAAVTRWRRWRVAWLPAVLAPAPLAVAPIIKWAGGRGASPALAAEAGLPLLAFLTGALGGLVFASAAESLALHSRRLPRAASVAYSADLAGACVAALATGLVLVPALGVAGTAYAVSAATIAGLAVTIISRRVLSEPHPR
jgi:spermidine synthase